MALSVPSSSGKGLQLHELLGLGYAHRNFQSPLHRGRVFNGGKDAMPGNYVYFFQSPLHRGRVFNVVPVLQIPCAVRSFSPLFIGEGSSTCAPAGSETMYEQELSVPSSWGKGLQLAGERWEAGCWTFAFQSPLHRGRVFNPSSSTPFLTLAHFQSPLHRGRVFNVRASWIRDNVRTRAFSPLFIGEGSSTSGGVMGGRVLDICLSVPSSSGKGLQPLQQHPLPHPRALSVPSSSGKGLQRARQLDQRQCTNKSFQSPLHRGRVFNYRGSDGRQGAGHLPFSPLFIGDG